MEKIWLLSGILKPGMAGGRGGEADQKRLPKRVLGGVFHRVFSEKWQRRRNHGEMFGKSMMKKERNGRVWEKMAAFGKSMMKKTASIGGIMMKCSEKAWMKYL